MDDRSERGSGVSDRLSRRFENEEAPEDSDQSEPSVTSQGSQGSQSSQASQHSKPSENEQNEQNSERGKNNVNVKQDWSGRYMYLPDEIDAVFDSEYDRLVYECGRELDWKPKKNKHYYPITVKHGVDAIEKMEAEEFLEAVENMNLR